MSHFLAFRVLGAEIFAVELGKAPPEDEERPKLEGGPGGTGQVEYGFNYQPSDVIVQNPSGSTLSQGKLTS